MKSNAIKTINYITAHAPTAVGKKMADRSVCAPQLAESDAKNNTTSPPQAASVTDADKVINTKLDSAQVEGEFYREHAIPPYGVQPAEPTLAF